MILSYKQRVELIYKKVEALYHKGHTVKEAADMCETSEMMILDIYQRIEALQKLRSEVHYVRTDKPLSIMGSLQRKPHNMSGNRGKIDGVYYI